MKRWLPLLALSLALQAGADDVRRSILSNPKSFYYVDFAHYPKVEPTLPVGVFDSGTGGLTVMNAMVTYDEHNNGSGAPGADGKPDFATEPMIYLADQANMPYGNYQSAGKTDLLVEHILKCGQFLLASHYYNDGGELKHDKQPVKAIVIACNTATAYGKTALEEVLVEAHSPVKVIGVIDAGARGALSRFKTDEDGSVGVFATAGTVASGGYARALLRLQKEGGYTGNIQVFNQGGVGLAEAIDEEPNFIARGASAPRADYKGPDPLAHRELLPFYHFTYNDQGMLSDKADLKDCQCLQINSPSNYVRYHLVSLLESMRNQPTPPPPLKALILGCTHYPYVQADITQTLADLRAEKSSDGVYRYRHLIGEEVALIDPSQNTARELYDHLHQQGLANPKGDIAHSEFYISVPNPSVASAADTEAQGARFSYAYKYGRNSGEDRQFVRNVPFSKRNISPEVAERLRKQIPEVFRLIHHFDSNSPKLGGLPADARL